MDNEENNKITIDDCVWTIYANNNQNDKGTHVIFNNFDNLIQKLSDDPRFIQEAITEKLHTEANNVFYSIYAQVKNTAVYTALGFISFKSLVEAVSNKTTIELLKQYFIYCLTMTLKRIKAEKEVNNGN